MVDGHGASVIVEWVIVFSSEMVLRGSAREYLMLRFFAGNDLTERKRRENPFLQSARLCPGWRLGCGSARKYGRVGDAEAESARARKEVQGQALGERLWCRHRG